MPNQSVMNFLLTPDQRGGSVVVACSPMSNWAAGLQTKGVLGHVRL